MSVLQTVEFNECLFCDHKMKKMADTGIQHFCLTQYPGQCLNQALRSVTENVQPYVTVWDDACHSSRAVSGGGLRPIAC